MGKFLNSRYLSSMIPTDYIERSTLVDKLSRGVDKRLTVIHAGGGYGKSVLLSTFLKGYQGHYLCFNAERGELDAETFFSNLYIRLKKSFGSKASGSGRYGSDTIFSFLYNVSAKLPDGALLAFDNYHILAANLDIKGLIDRILIDGPPNVRIILSSRSFPDIFRHYTAQGMERSLITCDDLSFSGDETKALLLRGYGIELPGKLFETFEEKAGGWAAGIRFLAEGISSTQFKRQRHDINKIECNLTLVERYFEEEIFSALPQDVCRFLVKTSIMEEFNTTLCERVNNDRLSVGLAGLQDEGIHIQKLRKGTDTYRYNSIFRDFLISRLKRGSAAQELILLHYRAASWFIENKRWKEATQHYISAGMFEEAEEVIERYLGKIIRDNDAKTLLDYLDQLRTDGKATLIFARGWANLAIGNNLLALRYLKDAIKRDNRHTLWHYYLTAIYLQIEGYEDARECAAAALNIPERDSVLKIWLTELYILSLINTGRQDEAVRVWQEEKSDVNLLKKALDRYGFLSNHAIYIRRGEFKAAISKIDAAVGLNEERRNIYYGLALGCLADIRHEAGDFALCAESIAPAIAVLRESGAIEIANALHCMEGINAFCMGIDELTSKDPKLKRPTYKPYLYHALKAISAASMRKEDAFLTEADIAINVVKSGWDRYRCAALLAPIYHSFGKSEIALKILSDAMGFDADARFAIHRLLLLTSYILIETDREAEAVEHIKAIMETGGFDKLFIKKEPLAALKVMTYCIEHRINIRYAMDIMIKLGRVCGPFMMTLLARNETEIKLCAIKTLRGIKYREAEADFLKLMQSNEKTVAQEAANALIYIRLLPPEPLDVQTFGNFNVMIGERQIREEDWKRKIAKHLFKYFIFNPRREITIEKIEELFFHDYSDDNARLNIRQAISTLRRVLEPGISPRRESLYIKVTDGSYSLIIPDGSIIDYIEFDRYIESARGFVRRGDLYKGICLYDSALRLYKGDIFEESSPNHWITEVHDRYKQKYTDLLLEKSRLHYERGEFIESLEGLNRLIAKDNWTEEAYLLSMKCHIALGERFHAIETYKRYCTICKNELIAKPGKKITDLYQGIMNL